MANSDCVFCNILAGNLPGIVIAETKNTTTLLSLENHPMIIPKTHLEMIYDLPESLEKELMHETVRLAKAVRTAYDAPGVKIVQRNGTAAGQEVFHLHIHVIPMSQDRASAAPHSASEEKAQALAQTITAALSQV